MHVLAIIGGFTVGIIVWFLASHWIASSITWVEDRHPELAGSRQLRVGEAVACGVLVLACFSLALWLIKMLWSQIR